jgi:ornithine cyclodeaminase/alanine dehydrogenase-like protein (mu-crystallin family)
MKQIYKGIEFSAVESAEDAVKNADIICTCTMAKEPVLKGNIIALWYFTANSCSWFEPNPI